MGADAVEHLADAAHPFEREPARGEAGPEHVYMRVAKAGDDGRAREAPHGRVGQRRACLVLGAGGDDPAAAHRQRLGTRPRRIHRHEAPQRDELAHRCCRSPDAYARTGVPT